MSIYAVVRNGQVEAKRLISSFTLYPDIDETEMSGDGHPVFRPFEDPGSPPFDPALQACTSAEVIDPDKVRVVYTVEWRALDEIKATLKLRVDHDAESSRQRYLTPGTGMALTYKEKQEQAHAVIDMGEEAANALPDHGVATFPILAASVGIEANTLHAVAQIVWQRFETFNALAYVIERTRLAGKKAISDASDAASAKAAHEAITWAV